MQTEDVAIKDLRPHPRNYNDHPEDQLKHLEQSIRENGVYRNVVIAKDNTILAGHGVVLAANRAEVKIIPVVRLNIEPDSARALKILAGDNEVAHLSMKDDRLLTQILRDIKEEDISGLLGTGYDEMMLANLVMVTRPKAEVKDLDEAAEWVGMPEYENVPAPLKIVVIFRNKADQQKFGELVEQTLWASDGAVAQSIWYPERKREDPKSVIFEEGERQDEAGLGRDADKEETTREA